MTRQASRAAILAAIVTVVLSGTSVVASARTFETGRHALKVRLVVRHQKIVGTYVRTLDHFRRGLGPEPFVPLEIFHLRGRGESIPIRADGRFSYRDGDGVDRLLRFQGRVAGRRIAGFFSSWTTSMDEGLVGTGGEGARAVHFVARAVR